MAVEIAVRSEITISAAHFIPGHPKCGKLHGHNYKVELWAGPRPTHNLKNGMLIDFDDMKRHLEIVVGDFDHAGSLNDLSVAQPPTAEILAWDWLDRLHKLNALYTRIRVWETEKHFAEAFIRQ